MPKNQNNTDDLCSAGKLLEVRLLASTESISHAAEALEKSSAKIFESIKVLTEYAIRDKERIDNLEESRKCKGKTIKELQQENHDMDVVLAKHLGEHETMKRQEGNTGRRWGFLSGAGASGGFLGIVELFKHLTK